MTSNEGNQNDGLASFDHLKYLANLMNFEDVNTDVLFSDDEIHKFVTEQEGSEEAKNLLVDLSKTPATNNNPGKKKCSYHQYPTKELEAYYKVCTHPDEKQRKALADELGLHHLQVMFWFKNKRKQMKTQCEHMQNFQFRTESEILKKMKFKENICLCSCNKCGKRAVTTLPEDYELRMENERLKKEYAKLLLSVRKLRLAE